MVRHHSLAARLLFALAVLAVFGAPVAYAGGGSSYALLVGCSQYRKTEFKALPYTGNDVLGFKGALLATGFDDDHVTVLHDAAKERRYQPLKANILQELRLIIEGMRPEDTLIVALSGHGLQYKGDPVSYFVPVDGKLSDKTSLIPLTGANGLYEQVRRCKARKKLMIVNACRNDPTVSLDFASNQLPLADEDRPDEVPEGIAAIYSCSAGQKSYYDPERKIALFYDHVIRAWRGEYSKGGPVTLEAFLSQVREKTLTDANRRLEVSQVPVIQRDYKGEWVIAAARKTAATLLNEKSNLPPSVEPAKKTIIPTDRRQAQTTVTAADGSKYVFRDFTLRKFKGDKEIWQFVVFNVKDVSSAQDLLLSADGRTLFALTRARLYSFDPTTGKALWWTNLTGEGTRHLSFAAGGQQIVVNHALGHMTYFDARDGKRLKD